MINVQGPQDQAAHFFTERMTNHEAKAWHDIAVVLSAEVERLVMKP